MKSWKSVALATGLAGALGLAVSVGSTAYAQSRPRAAVAPRADVFTLGGGGRIGVTVRDLEAEDLKGKVASGVAIDTVDEDSPASKAGLKGGDIVVEFDGERVRSVRQFSRLVSETPEGRSVAAAVMRDGQRVSVNVTPESSVHSWVSPPSAPALLNRLERTLPPRPATPAPPLPPTFEAFFYRNGNQIGVSVSELQEQLAEFFGTKDGVLVTSVAANSAAAKAGVKAGDVITSVNGSSINDTMDLRRRLQELSEGAEFSLGIVRNKQAMTLKGTLERPATRRRTSRTIL